MKVHKKTRNQKEIASRNDLCREIFLGCRVVMTAAVAYSEDRENILTAVRVFNDFTVSNDPYGEHDFGTFKVNDTAYFFKLDCYDSEYRFFQEDGHRVLTIGLMSDY